MKSKSTTLFITATTLSALIVPGLAEQRRSPAIPLKMDPLSERARFPRDQSTPPQFRSIDGTLNNIENEDWGAAGQTFLRKYPADFGEDGDIPSGAERPSARAVSNAVIAQEGSILNQRGATDFLWQWGQFLDHDITETPTLDPEEPFDIPVPTGDVWFDPQSTGEVVIPMNRSFFRAEDGGRQQVNAITSFIDASNVYGSSHERAEALRMNDGTGRLKVTESEKGDLLPYNTEGHENAPSADSVFFLAGDVRANEQIGLIAMHTLFVREHNYWADKIAKKHPGKTDEEIYQFARSIVGAEMQAITYKEFLPVLLGEKAILRYRGYRPSVDATIANSFAAACYRVGHTLLSPSLLRLDEDGAESEEGNIALADAFFQPSEIADNGIDSILRGFAAQRCQELDGKLVDGLRNLLFGPPGSGGFDLASLNIQRGRDHNLPAYADMRKELRLRPVRSMRDVTKNRDVQDELESVYDDPGLIDLWVGGLCEDHLPDAMVGPTFHRMLSEQFTRLRDGDRFWYQIALPRHIVRMVEEQTLAKIIRRNTEIGDEIPDNVFVQKMEKEEQENGRGGRDRDRGRRPRGRR